MAIPSGSQITATGGTETFGATANPITTLATSGQGVTFTSGTGTDTFYTNGNGSNTYKARYRDRFFYDSGPANKLDFSSVQTGSAAPLEINTSTTPQTFGTVTLNVGQAAVGNNPVAYTFLNSSTGGSDSDFTTVTGPSTGNTIFIAGGTGGLTFDGQDATSTPTNAVVFDGPNGIVANVSGSDQTIPGATQLGPSTSLNATVSEFTVEATIPPGTGTPGSGYVVVAPTSGAGSVSCTTAASSCDSVNDVISITGPAAGYSSFFGWNSSSTLSLIGQGTSSTGGHNTFYGTTPTGTQFTGSLSFASGGSSNDFVAGLGTETFAESGTVSNPTNTIDFSNIPVGTSCTGGPCSLEINVSGSAAPIPNDSAAVVFNGTVSPTDTYSFSTGAAEFTVLKGATGGDTTYYGGLGSFNYQGLGNDVLDFSRVPSQVATALTLDASQAAISLGGLSEKFSGITDLIGLSGGNTTFVGGSTGGYTYPGVGAGNTAKFSSQVIVNLTSGSETQTVGSQTFTVGSNQALVVPASGNVSCSVQTGQCFTMSGISSVAGIGSGGDYFYIGSSTATLSETGTTPDTLDFSSVATGPSTTLTIDSSNDSGGGTATVSGPGGTTSYNFAGGLADFLNLIGSSGGNTVFLASPFGGYSYSALGSNNSISFASSTSGVEVDFHSWPSETIRLLQQRGGTGPTTDTLTNLTTITGAAGGGNLFYAGAAPAVDFTGNGNSNTFNGGSGTDTFRSTGSSNTFVAGTGNETYVDSTGSHNTIDLSQAPGAVVVNVSGGAPQDSTSNDTATAGFGAVTYDFTSFGTTPVTFIGNAAGSTFFAGSRADTFKGSTSSPNNVLSFDQAPSTSLTITVGNSLSCAALGNAQLGAQVSFCGIQTFDGLHGGNTTFVGSLPGGYTFNGSGANNVVQFASTVIANTSGTTQSQVVDFQTFNIGSDRAVFPGGAGVTCTSTTPSAGCIAFSGVTSFVGAASGGNYFYVGSIPSTTEFFSDPGTVGGDTLDFSAVGTGGTTLTIDVSSDSGQGTATVASTGASYNFQTGFSDFTSFIGSLGGNTVYLANPAGGYQFTASGSGNSISFSSATAGVTVDLPTQTVSGLQAGRLGATTDALSGLTTIIGAASGGNVFNAGSATSVDFTGNGNNNTFNGGTGTDTFRSTGSVNTFKVGTGNETLVDSTGSNNTIDLSGLSASVTVNVSGGAPIASTSNDTARSGPATYDFTSFGTTAVIFKGSPTGSTFYAGSRGDTFEGSVGAANTLSFTQASSSTLTVNVNNSGSCLAFGNATIGATVSFCGIQTFDGLSSGSTTFNGDSSGGYSFVGSSGSNATNTVDFSNPVIVNTTGITESKTLGGQNYVIGPNRAEILGPGGVTCTGGATTGCILLSGITNYVGATAGGNYFYVGPISSTTESFSVPGSLSGNTLDFSAVPTSSTTQLVINLAGSPVNGQASLTAQVPGALYTFTNPTSDFTTFIGSTSADTKFIAPSEAGGYTFTGQGGNANNQNTVDFSRNGIGVVANLSPTDCSTLVPTVCSTIGAGISPLGIGGVYVGSGGTGPTTDTISGMQVVVGSSSGSNVFYGGLNGTQFQASSPQNTLSYIGIDITTAAGLKLDAGHSTVSCLSGSSCSGSDTYSFGSQVVLQGSNANDIFLPGSGSATFEGGGGHDTLDLSSLSGVAVDMQMGSITSSSINGTTFTYGCSATNLTDLCITSIVGSTGNDTYTANQAALDSGTPQLVITGGHGTNTLILSNITDQTATVIMPVNATKGSVAGNTSTVIGISFSGISDLVGTGTTTGGDHVYAGTGTETLTENGTSGTLDFSKVPGDAPFGVTINTSDLGGVFTGTVTSPSAINVTDNFTGFNTLIGTPGADSFIQSGPSPAGGYFFTGNGGVDTVNLSNGPTGTTLCLASASAAAACPGGVASIDTSTTNNGTTLQDTFSGVTDFIAAGATFDLGPGQALNLQGGGTGILQLIGAPPVTAPRSTSPPAPSPGRPATASPAHPSCSRVWARWWGRRTTTRSWMAPATPTSSAAEATTYFRSRRPAPGRR